MDMPIIDMVIFRLKDHAQSAHISGSVASPYTRVEKMTRYIDVCGYKRIM